MTYKVGDIVWVASFEGHEERIQCPVCYGQLQVTVILGNGEQVVVDCGFCDIGLEGPRGYVTEYMQGPRARKMLISRQTVDQNVFGEAKIEFYSDYHVLKPDRCFDTEAEALAAAQKLSEEWNAEQMNNPKFLKKNLVKSYAWNAGYHLREAASHRGDAEYHEKKAQLCKERAKKE